MLKNLLHYHHHHHYYHVQQYYNTILSRFFSFSNVALSSFIGSLSVRFPLFYFNFNFNGRSVRSTRCGRDSLEHRGSVTVPSRDTTERYLERRNIEQISKNHDENSQQRISKSFEQIEERIAPGTESIERSESIACLGTLNKLPIECDVDGCSFVSCTAEASKFSDLGRILCAAREQSVSEALIKHSNYLYLAIYWPNGPDHPTTTK